MTAQDKKKQITITFPDEATKDYVMLISRRKSQDIAGYLVDNFEWDDQIECQEIHDAKKIPKAMCEECDLDGCPDRKAGAP